MMGSSLFDGVDEQQKAVSRAIQDLGEKLEKKMEHMREDFQKASDSNGRTLSQYWRGGHKAVWVAGISA